MDSGTIYVREKGNLRRVSDIVLAQPQPVSSCRRTNPFVLRKEHFIFTYNAEGSLRYSTKSLFDITLLFVVDNIQHVDSLVGFPEQIGDRLFSAAEESRVFQNGDMSSKALQLFSDAYGAMVLESLCLRNRFPLLHEKMDAIKTFNSLTSLDLFGCRLGDNHDIFPHLTSSSLSSSLTELSIGDNRLSDAGIQRLTTPIRIMKKGLNCLRILDVSYNPLTEKALRYLSCLPKLEKLDGSGTCLKLGSKLKTAVWDLLGLIYSEKPLDTFDHSRCKTEGWAEQVINQWETNASQMPKQKKIDESRTSALRFFGRQKFLRQMLNAAPQAPSSDGETRKETLHFYRPEASSRQPDRPPSCHNVKKRSRYTDKCCSSLQSPPAKRLTSSTLTAEDMELLNSY